MSKQHDTTVIRLVQVLQRLNEGERLDPQVLAQEFNVSLRTIQRDLNERFAYLPLEKRDGRYSMDAAYLGGKLTFRDIQRFASLAGLHGLFPALDTEFLREMFDQRMQETLLIHGPQFEDTQASLETFRSLQKAIRDRREVSFLYRKETGEKRVQAHPYRLINHAGVWYLAATDQGDAGKPKSYALTKIGGLRVLETGFVPDDGIQTMLEQEDSIWLNRNKPEAVLKVAAPVAHYFRRRKLIAAQQIVKELEDGGLLISGKFAHPNQIIPIVRYWVPHVRIVSPEEWQLALERELRGYLEN